LHQKKKNVLVHEEYILKDLPVTFCFLIKNDSIGIIIIIKRTMFSNESLLDIRSNKTKSGLDAVSPFYYIIAMTPSPH
jgi:hypothetical protein